MHKINKKYNCNSKMTFYLREFQICGGRYTESMKTMFRSKTNNHNNIQQILMNKESLSKQVLKQTRFHKHYC